MGTCQVCGEHEATEMVIMRAGDHGDLCVAYACEACVFENNLEITDLENAEILGVMA